MEMEGRGSPLRGMEVEFNTHSIENNVNLIFM